MSIVTKVLSLGADNAVKAYRSRVEKINALEDEMRGKTDDELREMTDELRKKLSGTKPDGRKEEWEDEYRAFAILRERIRRHDGRRAYDVQLMAAMALYEGKVTESKTGEGKCLSLDTKIPTPAGWRFAGDIHRDDIIFDLNGRPTRVMDIYPQKKKEAFLVTLKDGRQIKASGDHLWSVYHSTSPMDHPVVHDTQYLYDHGIKAGRAYKWRLPIASAAQYPEAELALDPYVMGAFLGDGCRNPNGDLHLSSADDNIPRSVAETLGLDVKKRTDCYTWIFYRQLPTDEQLGVRAKWNDIAPQYRDLLADVHCHEKWIPEEYKTASIEQRWALIQGMMDTDGNIYGGTGDRFAMQYSTTSPRLRDDFMEVIYSLGMSCTWTYGKRAGQGNAKHDQFVIRINVDNDVKPKFFRLKAKLDIAERAAAHGHKRRLYNLIPIMSIEKLDEEEEMVCFTVANEDHMFLCGNYVPTHNTLNIFFCSFFEALHGKQTHVVSVNDYLTQRDSEEAASIMGPLGITVGRVYNQQPNFSKHTNYKADIVYGTPSEFGFDYLRDNMVGRAQDRVQREHSFAIVDEVDSILIDEARTPLIISGAGEEEDQTYIRFARAVRGLTLALDEEHKEGDYFVEEDKRQIFATEQGLAKLEERLGIENLYDRPDTPALVNHMQQALKAEYLFHRDKDYIVINGEVKIVDEFTGRIMEGRRWSDGLHQAIEAKEGVKINAENQTMATITLQNYFRLYDKLSGTTGTAATETTEFRNTYEMDVVTIPTNKPVIRIDEDDRIYRTLDAKFEAIADEIEERHSKGQPMLIGTASVANSERLSKLLDERGIPHETLNAKQHAREAAIVAQAGRYGAVTIATNMAGRGTDIILGGNVDGLTKSFVQAEFPDYGTPRANDEDAVLPTPEDIERLREKAQAIHDEESPKVIEAGGLCVIGSERHDSRRVDNQLRGRSGRQGDPGYSQFYISLEDDLMRLFGTDRMDRISNLMLRTDYPDDVPIQVPMVTKSIENAQRKVEEMNAAMRKNVLDYDDVVNAQRKVIYEERNRILDGEDLDSTFQNMIDDIVASTVPDYCVTKDHANWDAKGLCDWYSDLTNNYETYFIEQLCAEDSKATVDEVIEAVAEAVHKAYNKKKSIIGSDDGFMHIVRTAMLKVIDTDWVRHLSEMDYLKIGVGLRGMGQRDPLVEYKHDAYLAFKDLVDEMYNEVLRMLLRMRIQIQYVDEDDDIPEDGVAMGTTQASMPAASAPAAEERGVATDEKPVDEKDETEDAETEPEGSEAVADGEDEPVDMPEEGADSEPADDSVADEAATDDSDASDAEADSDEDAPAEEDLPETGESDKGDGEPEADASENEDETEATDAPADAEGLDDDAEPASRPDEDRRLVEGFGQIDERTGLKRGHSSTNSKTYVRADHDIYAGVGRNDPCPCGSGKKFKRCHGRRSA